MGSGILKEVSSLDASAMKSKVFLLSRDWYSLLFTVLVLFCCNALILNSSISIKYIGVGIVGV